MIYDNFEVQKPKRSSSCYDKKGSSSQANTMQAQFQNEDEDFYNNEGEDDEHFEDTPQYQHIQNHKQHRQNGAVHNGRYDIGDYSDSINGHHRVSKQQNLEHKEIENNNNKNNHLIDNKQTKKCQASDELDDFNENFYGDIEGERIEKSGNTYNDYMDQEDIFDIDQVNYDRMPQLGVRSNYSSNNTNTNNNNLNNLNSQHHNHNGNIAQQRNNNNNNDQATQQYQMRQFYNYSGNNCQICISKISLVTIVQEQLHDRYFELFNFYFAKGINEILANLNISHVILFKDYLFYDDDSEYLKRYYQYHEILPRFNLLADFYAHQYKETRPNLCLIAQAKVINKRNYKQAKLFISNQERAYRQNEQQQQNNNNVQENQVTEGQQVLSPSLAGHEREDNHRISNFLNELDTNFDNNSAQNNPNNESGILNNNGNGHLRRHQNTLQLDQQNPQYKGGSFMEEFNKFDKENSFESKSHDIYNPSYSSENESISSIHKDPLNQLRNLTNNQGQSHNNSQIQANYILELKMNWNDDIFIKNPNIRMRGNFISIQRSSSNIHTNARNNNITNNHTNTLPIQDKTNQISTSGQLTPKNVNYQYNELHDLESEMPSYLKMYVEEGQNVSFSQQQQSGNVSSQLSPVNQQKAQQIKYIQAFHLQQQINKLHQQHAASGQVSDDKQIQLNLQPQNQLHLSPESGNFSIQAIQQITPSNTQNMSNFQSPSNQQLNSSHVKDNKFKIPISKLINGADHLSNMNSEQWKQHPLSARNHIEANEDLRKKKNQHQKMMMVQNEHDNFLNKGITVTPQVTGQQINDLTCNSSTQNHQNDKLHMQQFPQSQNPSSNLLHQNSTNMISTDQNLPDQQYNELLQALTTPRDQQKQTGQSSQQLSKSVSKNSHLRANKAPLQVDTKPENNYDYLLKENPLSGGITGPSFKQHAQSSNSQQNLIQQQLLQVQQQQAIQSSIAAQQQLQQQQQQQIQQQIKSSLLSRLPQGVKQQLALNLNNNEQLQKNLKLNQNQQSPDRIWTDRDVNPRLAANPQKERNQQQNTVVIGKGEVKHLKGGKVLNRPLSNNNELIGSLSDRIFLNKIEEEGRATHHLPQDYNKIISEQHKDLSQKIIQNVLNSQVVKGSSQSNIQDIYKKYQQAKEDTQQYHNIYNHSNNVNAHEQQSLKGSGEHLSFIRSMQQKQDENTNEFLSRIIAMHNSASHQGDGKDEYVSNSQINNTNNKQSSQKSKQQQQSNDEMISKIHKSKINQLIQKAVPNSSGQSSSRKGVNANSSNNHGVGSNNYTNLNNVAKQSINNSSSQNSNYASATPNQFQLPVNQKDYSSNHQIQQQRSQNKKSPPHSNNFNNVTNFQSSQSSNNNILHQTSSGSNNTNNQTNFHNSQLLQLYQHNVDLYNNSISTISNTVMSKLQPQDGKQNTSTSKRAQQKDHHPIKQGRTSSLIKNLSGGDEIFNESNYKVPKQSKSNQVQTNIIVPSPQHLLQQYQSEQQFHNNYVGGASTTQSNQQNKSPISSTVSTSKNINQKQSSYSSMHNHLQNPINSSTNKPSKYTPNSTASTSNINQNLNQMSNINQNSKVFFKSINASGNTSGQALKPANSISHNNNNNHINHNNININAILTNNYVSPSSHIIQNSTTPINGINNFKSTNNTSVKSYQESHQNSMDKNGTSSRQLHQQQQQQQQFLQQQNQKNNSTNQSINTNLNSNLMLNNFNQNNSTFNQNNMINFDANSQLSRTMISTTNRGAGGFNEVNSFNNNETTLNQKSLIQPGSSSSTTGIINNTNNNVILSPNTPILNSHAAANLSSNQKVSSPNHKKKQKSESLSKSTQKINGSTPNQIQNAHQNAQQFISNELSGGLSQQSPNYQQNYPSHNFNQIGLSISGNDAYQQIPSKQLPSPSSATATASASAVGGAASMQAASSQGQNQFVPLKKQEFKLNISKIINQQHEFNQTHKNIHSSNSTTHMNSHNLNHMMMFNHNEENQENSYGFWTSRSNKQSYQPTSQLQSHGLQHGSASNSKYSSVNAKQANLTERKMLKTSNVSKQRKEAPAANLTDRNQYQRSQQYNQQSVSQKQDNLKLSPSVRKSNTQKAQNNKNGENHLANYNSLNAKEKNSGLNGSGSISGFVLKK